jgi:hypothetical protein
MEVFMNCTQSVAVLVTALSLVVPFPAGAGTLDKPVDGLGPYRLGATYDSLKSLKGFEDDPSRDDSAQSLKAARVIGPFGGQVALQRLFFKGGKLVRLSIIFGDPAFGEEKVKDLIANEWGDPGAKQPLGGGQSAYVWIGTRGTAMVVPADGGRWLAGLSER